MILSKVELSEYEQFHMDSSSPLPQTDKTFNDKITLRDIEIEKDKNVKQDKSW